MTLYMFKGPQNKRTFCMKSITWHTNTMGIL